MADRETKNVHATISMRVLRSRFAVVAAAALTLTAAPASSQTPVPQPPSAQPGADFVGQWAIERLTRDRWMHGRQQSRFTEFKSNRGWIFVDSLRDDATGRRLYLTLGSSGYGRDSALIVVGPTGRIAELHAGLEPFKRSGGQTAADSARFAEWQRHPFEGSVSLAETRVWDFVPTFPQATPHLGLSWTDTIAGLAIDGSFRQSLHGIRSSRITGDTVVSGHRLWVVHDSAVVQYDERYLEKEETLDTTVQVSRTAAGTIRGVHLYDPELRLFRWREDTTRLAGDAVLRYPDGRSFRTPARYERTRRWNLYDAKGYADLLAERRAAQERGLGGMVMVPLTELQRRVSAGDLRARDSVIGVWQRTSDPNEAVGLFNLLAEWSPWGEAPRAFLDSVRIAAGDTAYLYEQLSNRAYERRSDTADVKAMLPFMRDPGVPWSFNLNRDYLYDGLVLGLTTMPRAAAVGFDSNSVSCTIAACRMLGEQFRSAREQRLRDVGLVALLSVDPRRWADTVLALDGPRHPVLHPAALLAMGVGATWPSGSKAPLPPPNSDSRAWLEWMNGPDPQYAPRNAAGVGRPVPDVRFDRSHRTAIHFYMARTGRDVVGELQRAYERATSDSERLVFGTMLQRLDALQLTAAEVADAFTSMTLPARVELARQGLFAGFSRSATPMSVADAIPLMDRILGAVVDTAPLWRAGVPDIRTSSHGYQPEVHATIGRIFLDGDSLPDALRAKWAGRVEIIAQSAWNRRDPRMGGVLYTLAPIRVWGRFARVELTLSERLPRSDGQAPEEYASGNTYYLMNLNGEWVIVAQSGWVT